MRKFFVVTLSLLFAFYLWGLVSICLEGKKEHNLFAFDLDELTKSL